MEHIQTGTDAKGQPILTLVPHAVETAGRRAVKSWLDLGAPAEVTVTRLESGEVSVTPVVPEAEPSRGRKRNVVEPEVVVTAEG